MKASAPTALAAAWISSRGASAEEFAPLLEGERVELASGAIATDWTERLRVTDAEVVDTYADGDLAGLPAVTRRRVGAGAAWYVSADLEPDSLGSLVDAVVEASGVAPTVPVVGGVEAVRRTGAGGSWLFLINHADDDAVIEANGIELVTGAEVAVSLVVPGGAVRVVREAR